jgi:hypothetical protein
MIMVAFQNEEKRFVGSRTSVLVRVVNVLSRKDGFGIDHLAESCVDNREGVAGQPRSPTRACEVQKSLWNVTILK